MPGLMTLVHGGHAELTDKSVDVGYSDQTLKHETKSPHVQKNLSRQALNEFDIPKNKGFVVSRTDRFSNSAMDASSKLDNNQDSHQQPQFLQQHQLNRYQQHPPPLLTKNGNFAGIDLKPPGGSGVEDGYHCSDGVVIPSAWICDGVKDCANDGMDEVTILFNSNCSNMHMRHI